MHVIFVSGVFNVHMGLLMRAVKKFNITYRMLDEYVREWNWPTLLGAAGKEVFTSKRATSNWKDGTMKATASECLSVFPVVACFFEAVATKSANTSLCGHINSLLGLVHVIEMILKAARSHIDCTMLQNYIDAYLGTFERLYGPEHMTIKFHYLIHYPAFIRRWGQLPNCFALERKHKIPKRFGNEIRNTSGTWDASVSREVTNHHIAELTAADAHHFGAAAGLIGPHRMSKKLEVQVRAAVRAGEAVQFRTAKVGRINEWERICRRDVVLYGPSGAEEVGEVTLQFDYEVEGNHVAVCCVRQWRRISEHGRYTDWQRDVGACFWLLQDIRCCLTWSASGVTARTLRPLHS